MTQTRSISHRLIASLILVVGVMIFSSLLAVTYMAENVEEDISSRNLALAYAVAGEVRLFLEEPANRLVSLNRMLKKGHGSRYYQETLELFVNIDFLFEKISVLNARGHVVAQVPYDPEVIGLDYSRQPFFETTMRGNSLQWSDAFVGEQSGTPHVTAALQFNGGVIVGQIGLQKLSELTEVLFPTSSGFIAVLDSRGVIIGHKDKKMAAMGINLSNLQAVQQGLRGVMGSFREQYMKTEGIISVAPIANTGWMVTVFQPASEALAPVVNLRRYGLGSMALVALAAVGFVIMHRRFFLLPLARFSKQTEAISLGEYDARISPGFSEFKPLSDGFNEMAREIQQREAVLVKEAETSSRLTTLFRHLLMAPEHDTMVEALLRFLLDQTGSRVGMIILRNLDDNDFSCFNLDNATGAIRRQPMEGERFCISGGLWSKICSGKPYLSNEQSTHELGLPFDGTYDRVLGTALQIEEEAVGCVLLADAQNDYSESDINLLERASLLYVAALMRIRVEAQLIEARDLAEQSNKAKSLFLANMSHEIRTPLNGMLGMLQLMESTDLDEEQSEYARVAISSCHRLTGLLGDIIDISRIEAGRVEVFEEPLNLDELLQSIIALFHAPALQKGLSLNLDQPKSLGTVRGDTVRLHQVLNNLVGNAIKFTEQGSVTLGAAPLPDSSGDSLRVLFSVRDTGIGIREKDLEAMFDAFTQADDSSTRVHQGAGLGLSIVRELIKLMGGTLTVESSEGNGTSFYASIPFRKTLEPERALHADLQTPLPGSTTVLVVEDEAVNRLSIERLLQKRGVTAECAENGEEALRLLRERDYDLVFMDIQLPTMDGVEVTRRIRNDREYADKADIPIVALTAHAVSGDRERFMEAGMDDYLSKPVDIEELIRVMRKHL